jgi:glycosyltransferase involved in cell wall biosynthesis
MLDRLDAPSISVVIPTYNEAAAIAATVSAVAECLESHEGDWEIVVVDNASADGTPALVRRLGIDGVRVLENAENRGRGFSLRRGLLAAKGELRLQCDADAVASLRSLDDLLEAAESADVVAGSRLAPGADLVKQPLARRLAGDVFLRLTRAAMREPVRDVYCGFKLWHAEAAEAVFSRTKLTGWVLDAEALGLARALGFRTAEVPIVWVSRPSSRLPMRRVAFTAVPELMSARRNMRRERALRRAASGAAVEAAARG